MSEEFSEVVINDCFGGFDLSEQAIEMYLKSKGIKTYPEKLDGFHDIIMHWLSPPTGKKNQDDWRDAFHCSQIPRNDPDLIDIVKKLGEKANGCYAKLKIEKIPKETLFRISEYDGNESVEFRDDIDWLVS